MNVRTILSIGIRIFAVFLILEAVYTTLSFMTVKDIARENIGLLVVPVIYVVIAIIAWSFPFTIAKKLMPIEVNTEDVTSISAFDLARVGVALMALNLIINSAWSVIPAIISVSSHYGGDSTASLSSLIILAVGVSLLVGNRKVAYILVAKQP
ncbi:GNAT family acetyltransferase [Vibrio parahaemolyticus]|nr:GNAT family acetyltransferase [Vibrio parahaemolyticus]